MRARREKRKLPSYRRRVGFIIVLVGGGRGDTRSALNDANSTRVRPLDRRSSALFRIALCASTREKVKFFEKQKNRKTTVIRSAVADTGRKMGDHRQKLCPPVNYIYAAPPPPMDPWNFNQTRTFIE